MKEKIVLYQKLHPSSALFTHFDKTIYTNNENVWFTSYLLNAMNVANHTTLAVNLVNDLDHTVIIQEKFVMVDGIAAGNLLLSDSIAPGNYTFVTYTNRLIDNKPEVIFKQPVTIKNTNPVAYKATLTLTDSIQKSNRRRQVMLSVTGNNMLPAANAGILYQFSGLNGAAISGTAKADKAGQYLFNVPQDKDLLKVQVQYHDAKSSLSLKLPEQEYLKVKFYPESGNIIDNISGFIGWEVSTSTGQPVEAKGQLLENGYVIDTIKTDSYGLGKFALMPKQGSIYAVQVLGSAVKDSLFKLPATQPQGVKLTIQQAIANDTLGIVIQSTFNGNMFLNIHNFKEQFGTVPVSLKALVTKRMKLLLTAMPKGLATITLTDSLGRPYAERLFFAHYNQRNSVLLQTNKEVYNTREKVTLTLNLTDYKNKPLEGAVSVACVQSNRLEANKVSHIENYLYFQSELNGAIKGRVINDNSNKNKTYLENLLMIRSWSRYTWTDLLKAEVRDTVSVSNSAKFSGYIAGMKRALKQPASIVTINEWSTSILTSDLSGKFDVPEEVVISSFNKKTGFYINSRPKYRIQLTDPYISISKKVVDKMVFENFEQSKIKQSSDDYKLPGLEQSIQLKEVTISGRKDNSLYATGANACGDYVCMNRILNCQNHINNFLNKPPIIGKLYVVNGALTAYLGCDMAVNNDFHYTVPGIYYAKEFYGADYSEVSSSAPEYYSTVYWKHQVKSNAGNATSITFYTSDITGRHRVVVQGVTHNGVVYGEAYFDVVKKSR